VISRVISRTTRGPEWRPLSRCRCVLHVGSIGRFLRSFLSRQIAGSSGGRSRGV